MVLDQGGKTEQVKGEDLMHARGDQRSKHARVLEVELKLVRLPFEAV